MKDKDNALLTATHRRISAHADLANTPVRQRTVGMDVDSTLVVCAFLDVNATSVPIREFENSAPGLRELVRAAIEFQPDLAILESTGQYSLAVYDAFRTQSDIHCVVVNPMAIKALLRADGAKTDKRDAMTLARCGAMFPRLQWSNMPDPWQRDTRLHLRIMDEAIARASQQSNRLNATLRSCGIDVAWFGAFSSNVRWKLIRALRNEHNEVIAELHPRRATRARLATLMEGIVIPDGVLAYRDQACTLIEECNDTIKAETEWCRECLAGSRDYAQWMLTVPGTDELTALRVMAEFGRDFTRRYPNHSAFCSAAGTAPRDEVTGGRVVKLAETPGRKQFLTAFTSRLKGFALHLPVGMREWYRAYYSRSSYSKSLLALAHLISKCWYDCTKLGVPYDPYIVFKNRLTLEREVDPRTGEVHIIARSAK